uniref:7TM_GPCR_Srx domain-containing protein n=1 Tax=Angiostrongylus cantonensis TaxID=6313 RepID=A0A0K0DDK9_ANGCA
MSGRLAFILGKTPDRRCLSCATCATTDTCGLDFCKYLSIIAVVSYIIPYPLDYLAEECYVVFHPRTYLWSFSPSYCGFILGKVLDFGTGVTVFRIIDSVDENVFQVMRRRLRRQELKFFAQSCFQFGLFVIKLTNFYFISEYFTNDSVTYHWPLFFTTTFAWECTHCVDGYELAGNVMRKEGVEPQRVHGTTQAPLRENLT